jgi:hypothetical protein
VQVNPKVAGDALESRELALIVAKAPAAAAVLMLQDAAIFPALVKVVLLDVKKSCACALPPNAIEPNAIQLANAIMRKFMEISQKIQLSVLKIVSIQELSLHLRVSSFC